MNSHQITIVGSASTPESIGWRGDIVDITVEGEPKRVLVDFGNEMSRRNHSKTRSVDALSSLVQEDDKQIDAVILTHNHNDHSGGLGMLEDVLSSSPMLTPEAKFHMAPQSAELLPRDLIEGMDQGLPYTFLDAVNVVHERVNVIPKPAEYELFPGYEIYAPQMGHIPGACGVVFPTPSGNGFITGDWCLEDQYVTKGARLPSTWPKKFWPNQILGTDLTYGTGKKRSFFDECRRLVNDSTAAALKGEVVIIPAFMKGRGQNVAAAFAEDGRLAKAGVPVWIDGSIRKVYEVYQKFPWSERDGILPELGASSGIYPIESTAHRGEVIESTGPMVVITTAGMMDNGPVLGYMKKFLGNSAAHFKQVSYQARGTNGEILSYKWEKTKRTGKVQYLEIEERDGASAKVPILAKVERYGLSAHNDITDFEVFFEDLVFNCWNGEKLRRIILTHGTPAAKAYAAERFRKFTDEITYGERNVRVSLDA